MISVRRVNELNRIENYIEDQPNVHGIGGTFKRVSLLGKHGQG